MCEFVWGGEGRVDDGGVMRPVWGSCKLGDFLGCVLLGPPAGNFLVSPLRDFARTCPGTLLWDPTL